MVEHPKPQVKGWSWKIAWQLPCHLQPHYGRHKHFSASNHLKPTHQKSNAQFTEKTTVNHALLRQTNNKVSTSQQIVSCLYAHGDTVFSTQITSLATPPKPVGSFGRPFLLKNQTVPSQQSLKKTFLLSFEGKFQLGNAFVFVSLNILICQQTNFEFAVEQTTSC